MIRSILDAYRRVRIRSARKPKACKTNSRLIWLESLEDRVLLSTAYWKVDTNGSWDTAANWSTNAVPGAGDIAVINPSVPVTVSINSTDSVGGMLIGSSQTVLLTGGANFTISGTVTNNGIIELMPSTTGNVIVSFSGNVTLAGTGQMLMDPEVNGNYVITFPTAGSTVTNAAGHTVRSVGVGYFGAYNQGTVINQGRLEADGPGHSLLMYPSLITNQGTLNVANSGSVYIASSNTTLDNTAGQVFVDGSTLVNEGTIQGGHLDLVNGSSLYNGGSSFTGTITGSTLNLTGGSTLQGTGTLSNVTIPAGSDLLIAGSASGTSQTMSGTVRDNGTIELKPNAASNVVMSFSGNVTLAGTGQMLMDPEVNGNYVITLPTAGSTVTNAAGHTVRSVGVGYFGAYNEGTVVNQGVLQADGAGNALFMYPTLVTNQGTIEASNGGSASIASSNTTLDNTAGQVFVDGSTLVNEGTIQGGHLDLVNGSSLYNGGSSFTGTITGSTLNLTGGSTLLGTGTLTSITVPANSDLLIAGSVSGTNQTVTGTVTNDGIIELQPNANGNVVIPFSGNVTLSGTGQMLFDPEVTGNYIITYPTAGSTVTNAAGHTVRSVGVGYFGAYNEGTVVNQGTLEADGSGHSLLMYPTLITNQGTVKATNAASVYIASSSTTLDNTGGQILADGSTLNIENATVKGGSLGFVNGSTLQSSNGTLADVTVPSSSDLLITGSQGGTNLTISGTVTDNGTIELAPNNVSNVVLQFSGNVTLAGSGQLLIDPGTPSDESIAYPLSGSTVTNSAGHTVRSIGYGYFGAYNEGTIINDGVMVADGAGHSLETYPDLLTNNGTLQAINGGTVQFASSSMTLDNQGTIEVNQGTVAIPGIVKQVSGNTLIGGTWNVLANSSLILPGVALSINNANVLLGGPNASFSAIDAIAKNNGSFSVSQGASFGSTGDLQNSGTLNIGPGGILSVKGNYIQSAGGALSVFIGGTPASGQFGQLRISGTAALSGGIHIDDINNFAPSQGDRYQVMNYASDSGQFTSVTGLYAGRTQVFDLAVTATGVVLNALVNGADLAVTGITVPQNGISGQAITIGYTVQNLAANPTFASTWVDSVYLSQNGLFNPADKLIGRIKHTGAVDGGSSYTESLTAPLPGVVTGLYHVIVIADSQGFVPDVNRANNTLASSAQIAVTMPTIAAPGTVSGTIAGGQDVFYQAPLSAGPVVEIAANFGIPGGAQLYERYQSVPTSSTYDQLAFDPSQSQGQITLNGTQAGNYYLWLHGLASANQAYTISVQPLIFGITSISPTSGSDNGPVTLTVHGSQFTPKTMVSLVAGDTTLPAKQVLFQDNTTLFATFDLTKLTPGTYAVEIVDPGQNNRQPVSDPGAFTVTNGAAGQVAFSLAASAYTNNNVPGTITIDYTNSGGTDVPAPLMILSADTNVTFELPGETTPIPGSVQLLGINQNGPAGILPPGYHGTIRLTFNAGNLGAHQVTNFTLSTIPSATTPFDWSSVESTLQPPDVPSDAWAAIYQNFTAAVGTTLGQYQQVLDNHATYLSRLGEYTVDVSRLLSFELQKADDFGAISQRYTLGAFGRGWPDPTNMRAITDSAGNVTIEYSGRVRSFLIQPDGSYQAVPGDAATLTKEADGAYQLRETDGTLTVFNPDGTLDYTQDTNGNRITANYTGGLLTSFVDSTGDAVQFAYTQTNGQELITQVTDPVGRVTTYSYDSTGQYLLSVTDATGATSYTYVPGQGAPGSFALASITYPDGSQTIFSYDPQGRLTSQEADLAGDEKVTYGYDGEGGISVTDAGGGTSEYFVNEFEQVGAYEDPFGKFTYFIYDSSHNLLRETGPDGITSTFTTDAQGNPTGLTDPMGNKLSASYDPILSRLTSLTDSLGNTTQYGHDTNGNLLAITYPDSSQEQFSYDPMGNLIESVDRNGTPIQYKYDPHMLLLEEDFADGSKITYGYDAHRNLISATNSNGTTAFQYNAADQLIKVTYPSGMFLQFTYNPAGQRIQMVDQAGFTVNYQYDSVGRLSGLTDGSGNLIVKYTYDAAGRLFRKDMGNGTYTKYGYDLAGNLTSIVNYKPDSSVLSQYVYAYDDQGRPISVTTLQGTTTYGYDATGQLTSVSLPNGRNIVYQYDSAGNRVAVTDNGITTSYTTNNLNEYTKVGSTQYQYDKAGNLISQTDSSGTTSYKYNVLGQLTMVISPQGTWTYQYDALGNRIAETQNGQETQYLIDPTGIGNVVGTFDGGSNVIDHYTQGLGLTSQVGPTGTAAYYNFDLTGNTTELTGLAGAVLNSYAYLPFGEQLSAAGAVPNPFIFVGRFGVISDASGQDFMRNRWYDSRVGRFTQADPIALLGADVNFYRYAHNQPAELIDPTGLVDGPAPIPGPPQPGWQPDPGQLSAAEAAKLAKEQKEAAKQTQEEAEKKAAEELGKEKAKKLQEIEKKVEEAAGKEKAKKEDENNAHEKAVQDENSQRVSNFFVGVGAGIIIVGAGVAIYLSPLLPYYVSATSIGLLLLGPAAASGSSQHLRNGDPNSLTGPAGFGTNGYITPAQTLPYTINFANEPTADIPVQQVVVTDPLDPNLDWTTFQVGDFSIGGTVYHVPANHGFYSTQISFTLPANPGSTGPVGIQLDLTAGINLQTGVATWTFTSLDPATGDLPSDIFTGFLPPDATPPQGEAFVNYTIRPKASDPIRTKINAQATVVFDTNAPIQTNSVTNTIGPPPSAITARYLQGGSWWTGVSTGSSFATSVWATWSANVTWVDVVTGDFNGDGRMDIAGRVLETGQWWVGLSTGSSYVTTLWTTWSAAVTWADVQVGDFDGDGKADIAGRAKETGQWWVAQSTGSSFTNSLWATWNPFATWVDVKVGDFNGDGKADITGRYMQGGSWWTGISTGSSFNTSLWAAWNPNATWVDVQVGDFNGDGKSDIAGRYLQGGQWWTGISTGTSFITSLWDTWSTAVSWVDVKVGDFNGDGKMDIVGRALESGQWWMAQSTGSSFTNSLWATWSTAATWVDVQVGDFNGDGSDDLVGRVAQTGQWWAGISHGSKFINRLWTTWSTGATWADVHAGIYS